MQTAAQPKEPDAVSLTAAQVRAQSGQITLVAIGPLTAVEAFIDRDPALLRPLKKLVMMDSSIDRGYGPHFSDPADSLPHGPDAEWHMENSSSGARKEFASEVLVIIMALDATAAA